MARYLIASLIFFAAALAWLGLASAFGIWWTVQHPPANVAGMGTYFITSSWLWRLAVILPLVFFAAWYWRRVSHAV
jgi:hypothetical protein